MNKNRCLLVAACLSLFVPVAALAQSQMAPLPPKILRIGREEVKPGKGAAHEKMEKAWAKAFTDAKAPENWIGMTSLTGNGEVWFVSGYDSLADYQKLTETMDKMPNVQALDEKYSSQESEFLSSNRSIMGTYREELSYRGDATPVGKMRYFYATIVRVRPGHNNDFVEATKMSKAAHEKAGVPERWSVYEINLGMPHGTFLIIQPLKSLADVDAFPQTHGQPYRDAIGDEGRKKLAELASAGTITSETNILQFSPAMSIPPKQVAEADPDFWAPKPAMKAAPAAKKEAAKPKAQ